MTRYDLSGNLLPDDADAIRAEPVPGESAPIEEKPELPYRIRPAAVVPKPATVAPTFEAVENSSGLGISVPPEIVAMRWNWGAFFLPPLWCASNGFSALGYVYDLLIVLFLAVPFCYGPPWNAFAFWTTFLAMFGIGVFLGAKGHEIAWRNRQFDSLNDFHSIQRQWTVAGFAVALPLDVLIMGWFGWLTNQALIRQQTSPAVATSATIARPSYTSMPAPTQYQQVPAQPTVVIEHNENSVAPNAAFAPPVQPRRSWPATSGGPPPPGAEAPPEYNLNGNGTTPPTNGAPAGQPSQASDGSTSAQPGQPGAADGTSPAPAAPAGQPPSDTASNQDGIGDQTGAPTPQGSDSTPQGTPTTGAQSAGDGSDGQ